MTLWLTTMTSWINMVKYNPIMFSLTVILCLAIGHFIKPPHLNIRFGILTSRHNGWHTSVWLKIWIYWLSESWTNDCRMCPSSLKILNLITTGDTDWCSWRSKFIASTLQYLKSISRKSWGIVYGHCHE